jgi:transketolase
MVGWGRFHIKDSPRDWLVLAKGHATPALYTMLAELGYVAEDDLLTYRQFGSRLQGHPDRKRLPAVQVTTGHLGQGLSIASGIALGEKIAQSEVNVYAILGDGDLHEGQTWEAVMSSSHYQLDNLVVLLDLNQLTQHGLVEKVMSVEPLAAKWASFGWATRELDGHDYEQILAGLQWTSSQDRPCALLCHTVKGKGVNFMEGDPLWHSTHLSEEKLNQALQELEGA